MCLNARAATSSASVWGLVGDGVTRREASVPGTGPNGVCAVVGVTGAGGGHDEWDGLDQSGM